jgi:hypothetical protein
MFFMKFTICKLIMLCVWPNSLNSWRFGNVNSKTKAYSNHNVFDDVSIMIIGIPMMNLWYKVLVILANISMCEQGFAKQNAIKSHIQIMFELEHIKCF